MNLSKNIRETLDYMTGKKKIEPVKSETGSLIVDKDGVASVDYTNPEAKEKLKKQMQFFAKIKLS